MPFQCLSEEIAAAPVPMEVTPTQRMMSACAGVLATSLVVTPMGEKDCDVGCMLLGRRGAGFENSGERQKREPASRVVCHQSPFSELARAIARGSDRQESIRQIQPISGW